MMKMNKYTKLPKDFTFTAHTGCMGTVQNSLESIKAGAESGAPVVEFDLRFTDDGEPVLSHDEPVGGEVTLDKAFEYVSQFDNIKVNVDIKTCDALGKVYPLAEKYGIEKRIFYTGVHEGFVESVKKDSPEVPYYLNFKVKWWRKNNEKYILSVVDKVKQAGAVGINFKYTGASEKLVKIFHEKGLLVSIWTVDDEKNMYKILSFAPDNITTRHPDKLSGIVKDFQ